MPAAHRDRAAALDEWRPPPLSGGRLPGIRLDPGHAGARALCVVALGSAALAAGVTWISRPGVDVVAPVPVVSTSAAIGMSVAPGQPSTQSSAPSPLVVSVVGLVATPGLVTLPPGSRVADAVAAAGGLLPEADPASVNLARLVVDGEQIAVGVPGAAPGPAAAGSGSAGLVDLNTASEQELEGLPGVGPVLAGRIVAWREDNGGFTSVEDLQNVEGVGPATFAELQDLVTV